MGAVIMLLLMLLFMGVIYPCGAFAVWFVGYRKKISLKEFWENI